VVCTVIAVNMAIFHILRGRGESEMALKSLLAFILNAICYNATCAVVRYSSRLPSASPLVQRNVIQRLLFQLRSVAWSRHGLSSDAIRPQTKYSAVPDTSRASDRPYACAQRGWDVVV
jgi:hypothetical protein